MDSSTILDVLLFSRDGHIFSSLYRKLLSGNTLLHADSGHPRHTIRGILVGQLIRLQRICSEDTVYEEEKQLMNWRFLSQGYELGTIQRAINIVDNMQRKSLLEDKVRKWSSVCTPVFSTPYNLEFNKIRRIIEQHIPILYEDDIYLIQRIQKGFKTVSWHALSLSNSLSPSDFCSFTQSRTWLDFVGKYKCGANTCPC